MLELGFWITAIGVLYSYFIYPAILLLCRKRERTFAKEHGYPYVSFIIAAHNEEGRIEEKILNSLAVDYPRDRLEIIIASDASTDQTDMIVGRYADRGIRLVRSGERKGKEYAQLLGIRAAQGEVLVFSDVATNIPNESLHNLLKKFTNPEIGAVSSEDRFIANDGRVSGEGLYVKYEMALRKLESRVNSLVGLSGSFFAARKVVCKNWDTHVQSDFNTALNCARLGLSAVTAPDVLGYYRDVSDPSREYARKYRTVLRGIASLMGSEVLNPSRYGFFAFQVFSHKAMRWLVPWFLVMNLWFSVQLSGHWVYAGALFLHLVFYLLALYGWVWPRARRHAPVRVVFFFAQVNIAIAHALVSYAMGKRILVWAPSRR
jgi:cellulose synthase/poly-beta-1,6-N-acetylglucosamine synthase-like glycosyltransferase